MSHDAISNEGRLSDISSIHDPPLIRDPTARERIPEFPVSNTFNAILFPPLLHPCHGFLVLREYHEGHIIR